MKNILLLVLIVLVWSCQEYDKGKIKVQNNVHNVKLESINWGDYSIYSSLITGQTSPEITIEDKKGTFPKIYELSFYMVSGTKKVYLQTKQKFQLDADNTITIVISDTTGVTNPALK
jgi:hypothetical protein